MNEVIIQYIKIRIATLEASLQPEPLTKEQQRKEHITLSKILELQNVLIFILHHPKNTDNEKWKD